MWHVYSRLELPCNDANCCTRAPANNYWKCSACAKAAALDTMISTLRGYDVQRHLSARRMKAPRALPMGAAMLKYRKTFVATGGRWRASGRAPAAQCKHGCCFNFKSI